MKVERVKVERVKVERTKGKRLKPPPPPRRSPVQAVAAWTRCPPPRCRLPQHA
jgi:hypothetical protein